MTTTTEPAKAPRTSRAGRDLPAAIVVGLGLGVVVVASLAYRKEVFAPVMGLAILVGAWELRGALKGAHIRVSFVPVAIGSVSMITGALVRGPEALILTFGLTCIGLLIWRVADGVAGASRDLAGSLFVALYPCFLAGFPALMLAEPDGNRRILLFIIVTIASDIGGYLVGVLIGRHPMAPSVSPKKSWEGFVGSVLACGVAGAYCMRDLFEQPWWQGAVLGVVVALAATGGDLVESLIKRDLGIKDMGSLLPGHGGVMDRLDSLIICAPVVWAFLLWFVPSAAS